MHLPFPTYKKSASDDFGNIKFKIWKIIYQEMKEYQMKRVENIVAKEEIVHYEQFLNLSQYFQNLSTAGMSKCNYMRERFNF